MHSEEPPVYCAKWPVLSLAPGVAVLYCIVLFCFVLYCMYIDWTNQVNNHNDLPFLWCPGSIVLFCIVCLLTVRMMYELIMTCTFVGARGSSIVLYWIVLYCTVLYCIYIDWTSKVQNHDHQHILWCSGSSTVLYYIVLYCIALYCIVLHCIALYCMYIDCTNEVQLHNFLHFLWCPGRSGFNRSCGIYSQLFGNIMWRRDMIETIQPPTRYAHFPRVLTVAYFPYRGREAALSFHVLWPGAFRLTLLELQRSQKRG